LAIKGADVDLYIEEVSERHYILSQSIHSSDINTHPV